MLAVVFGIIRVCLGSHFMVYCLRRVAPTQPPRMHGTHLCAWSIYQRSECILWPSARTLKSIYRKQMPAARECDPFRCSECTSAPVAFVCGGDGQGRTGARRPRICAVTASNVHAYVVPKSRADACSRFAFIPTLFGSKNGNSLAP